MENLGDDEKMIEIEIETYDVDDEKRIVILIVCVVSSFHAYLCQSTRR